MKEEYAAKIERFFYLKTFQDTSVEERNELILDELANFERVIFERGVKVGIKKCKDALNNINH